MGGGMKNVVYTSERAEVVHAHWAFKGTAYGCSRCGHGAITPFGNYCEGCGAKMDALPDGRLVQGRAPDLVAVVHGRWVEEDRIHHWHCSACGFVTGLAHRFYRFCPNCGARMDGLPDGELGDEADDRG